MTISYCVTVEDIVAACQHYTLKRRPALVQVSRTVQICVTTVLVLVIIALLVFVSPLAALAGVAIWNALYFLRRPLARYRVAREVRRVYRAPSADTAIGATSLAVEPDGIIVSTASTSSRFLWTAIQHVGVAPTHFFIYLGPGSSVVVPRRSLTGHEDGALYSAIISHVPRSLVSQNAA